MDSRAIESDDSDDLGHMGMSPHSAGLRSLVHKTMESIKERSKVKDLSSPVSVVFLFVIGQWTTYQCVSNGKEVLHNMIGFEIPLLFTIMEIPTLVIFFRIKTDTDKDNTEGLAVLVLSHIQYVFMTSYWFLHLNGSLSECIGYLAPIVTIVLQLVCKDTRESNVKTVCSFLITSGAILASHTGLSHLNNNSFIQFIAVLSLILRNICLKHFITEKIKIQLQVRVICTYVALLMLGLFLFGMISDKVWTSFIILGLFSAMISSMSIYVIFDHVLQTQSVLFVSVLNVYGQLIVKMIFVKQDILPYASLIAIGSIVACVGTIVFLKSTLSEQDDVSILSKTETKHKVSENEFYTRVEFILFAGCVIGLFFFILEPRVSERDMKTFSYVGLDKFFPRSQNRIID